jgi:outer membrane protein insertion porin family
MERPRMWSSRDPHAIVRSRGVPVSPKAASPGRWPCANLLLRFRGVCLLLFGLALLLLLPSGVRAQGEQGKLASLHGKPIARIEILVNEKLLSDPPDEIVRAIPLRVGDSLRLADVRRAILALYEAAVASDVLVEAEETASGVRVRFRLTPQPRIGRVSFQGGDPDVHSRLLLRLGELAPGARFTEGLLSRATDEIVEFYHSLGFFECEVTPQVTLADEGRTAHLLFRITPGPLARVADVRLTGDLKIPREEILARLESKPGAPFDALRLHTDLHRIRELHLRRGYRAPRIAPPRLERVEGENAVIVEIAVESGPLVDVEVEGLSLSAEEMRRLLPILHQGGLDDATLEEGRVNLLDYVQRQGYFFADVRVMRTEEGDRIRLRYVIERGRRYTLRALRLEGTSALTLEELRPRLGSILGGVWGRGLTSRQLMQRDQHAILEALREHGYARARVVATRLAVGLKKDDLIIIYVVEEGPRLTLARVTVEGARAFAPEELVRASGLRPDTPFAEARVREAVARLTELYADRGYAEATITPLLHEDDDHRVTVTFRIREGKPLRIGAILIRGNQLTRERAITRYLSFREGDLFRPAELARSEERLYGTGAFRRVSIAVEPTAANSESEAVRNVRIEVDEAPRYQMTYGFGFRTDDGPRGLFELSNTNLLGSLRTASFRLRASRREQIGQLSLTDPKLFGTELSSLLSALFQRQEEVAFDASRLTVLAQVEKPIGPRRSFLFRYTFSNVIISNVTEPEELRREDTTIQLGRVSTSFVQDSRDNPFDPTRGAFTTLDLSVTSRLLGGSENFLRFFGEHQRMYRLSPRADIVLASNVRLGLAHPYGRSRTIPISERFFAGGSTTLRGFGFEQAGPRAPDPHRPGRTRPLGGNALLITNAELRFPLWRALRLGGAIFYDGGNIFARISEVSLRDFTHTLGFGLRIKTPLGPLRLDVGTLVTRIAGVPRAQFHITFGNPF